MWKLSGLFSLTIDQSVQAGVADLETAMAEHGNDNLVIYGYSQGAVVANVEKRKLAEQYPGEPRPPTSTSCSAGTPIFPTAVFLPGSRASTFRSSISFNGPAPTDTQFDTVEITRQYDFLAEFPLYPLNVIAD